MVVGALVLTCTRSPFLHQITPLSDTNILKTVLTFVCFVQPSQPDLVSSRFTLGDWNG